MMARIKNGLAYLREKMQDIYKTWKRKDILENIPNICCNNICFVLIHTGNKKIPSYILDCIKQIRLFNDGAIIFVCEVKKQGIVEEISRYAHVIDINDIKASNKHLQFLRKVKMQAFAKYTTDRFFILEEVISCCHLKNVIHIENDVLVYDNFDQYLELLSAEDKLHLTRHNDYQCIGGLVFVPSENAIAEYTQFLLEHCVNEYMNDMDSLSLFAYEKGVSYLPVITQDYYINNGLRSIEGHEVLSDQEAEAYFNNVGRYNCIFDAAAIGQYIGGIDKIHNNTDTRGYINTNCMYNASKMQIIWKCENDLYIPYINEGVKEYRLVNLHIHSKELKKYMSIRT